MFERAPLQHHRAQASPHGSRPPRAVMISHHLGMPPAAPGGALNARGLASIAGVAPRRCMARSAQYSGQYPAALDTS